MSASAQGPCLEEEGTARHTAPQSTQSPCRDAPTTYPLITMTTVLWERVDGGLGWEADRPAHTGSQTPPTGSRPQGEWVIRTAVLFNCLHTKGPIIHPSAMQRQARGKCFLLVSAWRSYYFHV